MPSPTSDQATRLRRRAAELQHLAARIETTTFLRLDLQAGVDTWRGPLAVECTVDLGRLQHRLHVAADDLRSAAWRLRLEADELDRVAALTGAVS